MERQLTFSQHGHILTNCNVWSPDARRIIYDVRSDPAGSVFDGDRIETVDVVTGEVRVVYRSTNGAKCGVATYHPIENTIVCILGPDERGDGFTYAASRRQGILIDEATGEATNLDARDLSPPFTPGALRGGTHLHTFSPDGRSVAFTYEDDVFAGGRNVGVSVLVGPSVSVPRTHARNHDGQAFTVLLTQTGGGVVRACEEAWIDSRSLAFLGDLPTPDGETVRELFVVELPDEPTRPGHGPLQGTATTLPRPPRGVLPRRLGIRTGSGEPRFWPRSNAGRIAHLVSDEAGVVQLWIDGQELTRNPHPIASAFTWTTDGSHIAHAMDGSVCLSNARSGGTRRITGSTPNLRPEACVVSPDGKFVAYLRHIDGFNQIFVAELTSPAAAQT